MARGSEAHDGAVRPVTDGTLVAAPAECETARAMTAVPGRFLRRRESPGLHLPGGAPLSDERTGPRGRLAEGRCCLRRLGGNLPGQWTPSREGPGSMRLSS